MRRGLYLRWMSVAVASVALLIVVGCAQTDAGLTTKVKTKLAADDTVKAYQIDVDTKEKVVTLTGTVDSQAAKDQAIALTRSTEGVRDVVDNITVSGTGETTTMPEMTSPETMGTPGAMSTTPGMETTPPGASTPAMAMTTPGPSK